jgi:chromosome partitioning protein
MIKVISICNQKGGVGKTTSAVNIAAGLNMLNKKVLLIDLDPQSHLTVCLGLQLNENSKTIYNLLKEESKINETIIDRNGLKIIPSSITLAVAEMEFIGLLGREFLLKEALRDIKDFHYIIIDCPPSFGLLTLNALTASHEVYIPLQTEYLALKGMSELLTTINTIKKKLNPELQIAGVIATRYNHRKLNKEVIEGIKRYFENKLMNTLIRENISLAEAPSQGKTIFEYESGSAGAEDYLNLCKEILNRG